MSLKVMSLSLVTHIKDLLFSENKTVCDFQGELVHWFVDIEAHSAASSMLFSELVLLSLQAFTVPKLSVAFIAGGVRV